MFFMNCAMCTIYCYENVYCVTFQVLNTAVSVVQALPPLSLAVETKLPRVGLTSLNQLTQFLSETVQPTSQADNIGKKEQTNSLLH